MNKYIFLALTLLMSCDSMPTIQSHTNVYDPNTKPNNYLPSPPTDIQLINPKIDQLRLQWKNGSTKAQKTQVRYYPTGYPENSVNVTLPIDSTSYTLPLLSILPITIELSHSFLYEGFTAVSDIRKINLKLKANSLSIQSTFLLRHPYNRFAFATLSYPNELSLWGFEDTNPFIKSYNSDVSGYAKSPDGSKIAILRQGATPIVDIYQDGVLKHSVATYQPSCYTQDLRFHPNSQQIIVSCSYNSFPDSRIYIIDANSGRYVLIKDTSFFGSPYIPASNDAILLQESNNTIHVLDINGNHQRIYRFTDANASLNPNGQYLVTCRVGDCSKRVFENGFFRTISTYTLPQNSEAPLSFIINSSFDDRFPILPLISSSGRYSAIYSQQAVYTNRRGITILDWETMKIYPQINTKEPTTYWTSNHLLAPLYLSDTTLVNLDWNNNGDVLTTIDLNNLVFEETQE